MKIAIIAQRFSIGGWRVLNNLLLSLKDKGNITLFLDSNDAIVKDCVETFNVLPTLKENNIDVQEINTVDGCWNTLGKRLNRFDSALFFWPFFCSCPENIQIPFYFLVHDLTILYRYGFVLTDSKSRKEELSSFLKNGGVPIVLSENGKEDFIHFFGSQPAPYVCPWAHFSTKIEYTAQEDKNILSKFNLKKGKYFIYPTNNSPHKNNQLVLKIEEEIKKTHPDIQAVFCGYGTESLTGNLLNTRLIDVNKNDKKGPDCIGLGLITDKELVVLIKNALCLISTSFAEGGCGPASDAWFLGTPTVISDILVLKEYADIYGVKTEFASPFNASDFAEKIIRIINNKNKYLESCQNNQKMITTNYTWKDVGDKYFKIFTSRKSNRKINIAVVNQVASVGGWRYLYFLIKYIKKLRPQWGITVLVSEVNGIEEFENLKKLNVSIEPLQVQTFIEKPFKKKQKFKIKFFNRLYNSIRKRLYRLKRKPKKIITDTTLHSLESYDAVFYAWPFFISAPQTSAPCFFIPHDFIISHGFGLDGCHYYDQACWNNLYPQLKTFIDIKATPIVSSEYIRDEFNRVFPDAEKKPNVVYVSSFSDYKVLSQNDVNNVLNKYGIKNKYILFSNNNMPHKNLSQVIGAMYYVLQKYPDVKLIVSGFKNQGILGQVKTPYYMDHTADENNWDVKGVGLLPNNEFSALLQGAEMVINASLCEAGGGNALDAWKLGIPMVMSNIPAFKNQMEFLGTKAELFEPRESRSIANAILKMLDYPEIAKENARISKEAMEKYSWDKVAEQYISIFEEEIR